MIFCLQMIIVNISENRSNYYFKDINTLWKKITKMMFEIYLINKCCNKFSRRDLVIMYAYPVKLSKLSPHCCPKPSSHAITPYIHVRAIMHPQHAIQAPLILIRVCYDEVQNYHLINYTNIYMHNVKLQRLFQSRNICWVSTLKFSIM